MNYTISRLIFNSTENYLQSTIHLGMALNQLTSCKIKSRRGSSKKSREFMKYSG